MNFHKFYRSIDRHADINRSKLSKSKARIKLGGRERGDARRKISYAELTIFAYFLKMFSRAP